MKVAKKPTTKIYQKDPAREHEFLRYAEFLVRRGLIANTLGNMAVRVPDGSYPEHGVVYTKRRGVSLEEMTPADLVVTDVQTGRLLSGSISPSNGHKMNRAILAARKDANAVIHTHSDVVIGYFSQNAAVPFRFVSIDTALVLGAPPTILPVGVNIETDPAQVEQVMLQSNCFVMPNHGLVTIGRNLDAQTRRHYELSEQILNDGAPK
jgi:L-fuculose-phosphate aldolase